MSAPDEWQKHGRDAAREDIASVDDLLATLRTMREENADLRAKLEASQEAHERDDKALHEAQTAAAYAVRTARREGAEAMREACAAECDARATEYATPLRADDAFEREVNSQIAGALRDAASAIRAIPLPEVTP